MAFCYNYLRRYNKLGQLAEFFDSLSGITSTFDYDALGRLTSTVTSDGSLDSEYIYNGKGQLSNRHYTGNGRINKTQNFSYNSDGYLTIANDTSVSTTNTIDKFGRVTQLELVNTTTNNVVYTGSYTYYDGSGGAKATTTLVEKETMGPLGYVEYFYSDNGMLEYSITTRENSIYYDASFCYDSLNQLISEENPYTNQTVYYTYDAGGNIISRQTYDGIFGALVEDSLVTDTYTYGNSEWKDLLTAYNGQTITYDEIGNPLTYRRGETMTWEGGRRLSEVDFDDYGDMLFFDYDSNGMRLSKYGPRVGDYNYTDYSQYLYYVDYYYDGDTLIYERRSGDGDNETERYTIEYAYGVNGITGFRIHQGNTTTDYYYVKNIMGDVLGIIDGTGTLVAEYRYDAYGNPVQILDGNGNDVSANYSHIANINPIRYRGYYYDIESGFYYLNSRYYDPVVGRFISADGVIDQSSVLGYNLFAYCHNNPVNMVDSSGNLPKWLSSVVNVVSGVAQMAVGAALAASTCVTGVGTVAGVLLLVNGAATITQGVGQIVNDVTKTNVMREDNLVRTGVQEVGRAIGGDTGAKIMGGIYDLAVLAASIYSGVALKSSSVCFVAGTAVLTSMGYDAIENIQVGDTVWAENPETGEKALKKVVQTFENETNELVHMFVNGEEILTTPEHPFYSPTKGWSASCELRAGDILVSANGQYVVVEKIQHEILETPIKFYNFEVADFHTYYVGECAVLVHNTCVVKENGVRIESYYPNDHGNPAHLHVYGGGKPTKIGPQGLPVAGYPNLSPQQATVVEKNLATIKKAIKEAQKILRLME